MYIAMLHMYIAMLVSTSSPDILSHEIRPGTCYVSLVSR